MHTNIFSKKLLILFVITIILLIGVVIINKSITSKASGSDNVLSVKEILQAQLDRGNLQNELGESNIYPEYYTSRHLYNMTEDEVKYGLIENKALQWYAQKNNIDVSDKALNEYMQDLLSNLQDSEEYDIYSEAAKSLNTTFEDIVLNDSKAYRDIIIKNQLFEKYIIKQKKILTNNENTDEIQAKYNKQWDIFVKDVINQYKNKDATSYKILLNDFIECESLVNDNITNINIIKASLNK